MHSLAINFWLRPATPNNPEARSQNPPPGMGQGRSFSPRLSRPGEESIPDLSRTPGKIGCGATGGVPGYRDPFLKPVTQAGMAGEALNVLPPG